VVSCSRPGRTGEVHGGQPSGGGDDLHVPAVVVVLSRPPWIHPWCRSRGAAPVNLDQGSVDIDVGVAGHLRCRQDRAQTRCVGGEHGDALVQVGESGCRPAAGTAPGSPAGSSPANLVPALVPRRRHSACRRPDRNNTVSSRAGRAAVYVTLIAAQDPLLKLICEWTTSYRGSALFVASQQVWACPHPTTGDRHLQRSGRYPERLNDCCEPSVPA